MVIARRIFVGALLALFAFAAAAQDKFIVVASTTSTEHRPPKPSNSALTAASTKSI